jgi:adenine C2-methylase RlmN of 23S rRNA A2503 and tRNA A37
LRNHPSGYDKKKINLKALSKEEIFNFIRNFGLPRYRASQLIHWMYKRHVSEINEINLTKD